MIEKLVAGGQTGADRAALDVAIEMGLPHGGWVPKGRLAEDGPVPDKYHLQEMRTTSYPKRTEQNILDSDGTLIVSHGKLTGGSQLTMSMAYKHNKPWIHVDLKIMAYPDAVVTIRDWIDREMVKVLNVAGPRASKDPQIYQGVKELLEKTLA